MKALRSRDVGAVFSLSDCVGEMPGVLLVIVLSSEFKLILFFRYCRTGRMPMARAQGQCNSNSHANTLFRAPTRMT
jgi:hypothetical protein